MALKKGREAEAVTAMGAAGTGTTGADEDDTAASDAAGAGSAAATDAGSAGLFEGAAGTCVSTTYKEEKIQFFQFQ